MISIKFHRTVKPRQICNLGTLNNVIHMHNPPHPGKVLREYLGDITMTNAAEKLGVNQVTLSRVISGSSSISADMAYRLGEAFGTDPELWTGMQLQYDLYQAAKIRNQIR